MNIMRKFKVSIAAIFSGLLLFTSCKEEDIPNESPSEKAVKEIVEELEKIPEVSDFVQALKETPIKVESEELTVFAVQNKASRAETDGSVERQVVVGRYLQDKLESGMFLYTVDKDSLLVEKNDTATLLNGIPLTGTPQTVGSSIVYMVPEYFPKYEEKPQPEIAYELKVRVWRVNDNWSPENPAEGFQKEGIKIVIYEASESNELVMTLDTLVSDKDGYVTVRHNKKYLAYKVCPNDSLSSFYDGYHVVGVFTSQKEVDEWAYPVWGGIFKPGDYKLDDLNRDGLIDNNDKISDEDRYVSCIDFSEESRTREENAYLVKKETAIEEPDYKTELQNFKNGWKAESLINNLAGKDAYLSSYPKESAGWLAYSDSIWQNSEKLLISFDKCNNLFAEAPEDYRNMWLQEVAYSNYGVECLFIYTLLNQYYKGAPIIDAEQNYSSREEGKEYLQNEFYMVMQNVSSANYKTALNIFMARFYLSTKQYEMAYEASRKAVDEISESPIFTLGKYLIQEEDVWLVYAEAALNIGNTIEAMQYVNRITVKHNLPPYLSQAATLEEIRECILNIYNNGLGAKYLPNGGMMKYAETSRFRDDKYGALPFPQWLIQKVPVLVQNPWW